MAGAKGPWWATRGAAVGAWAVAGWPVWRWYVARIRDGSDEPWGLAALVVALAFVPWRRLREPVSLRGAVVAGGAMAAVFLGYDALPALVRGGLWMLALAALVGGGSPASPPQGTGTRSQRPSRRWRGESGAGGAGVGTLDVAQGLAALGTCAGERAQAGAGSPVPEAGRSGGVRGGSDPALARGGLLVLSLPVVATAQFYLGYPLRAVTAACSVPLLRLLGYAVERQGTALRWAGETVLVDAPCSGIQMLWTGLLAACVLAAVRGLGGWATWRLLRWAGAAVAGANLVRCVALFLVEVKGGAPAAWLHAGIGLVCFGAALGVVAWRAGRLNLARAPSERSAAVADVSEKRPYLGDWLAAPRLTADWVVPVIGLLLVGVAVRPLFGDGARPRAEAAAFPGWPATFEGRGLTPLVFSEREARFAAGFPGKIGVFSDGERTILLRWVPRETRQLHPALHCLRGLGYAVEPGPVWRDATGRNWGTTLAERDGRRRRVRERISDGAAREWTDVSAWWWDAWRGASAGPWWAATVFEE